MNAALGYICHPLPTVAHPMQQKKEMAIHAPQFAKNGNTLYFPIFSGKCQQCKACAAGDGKGGIEKLAVFSLSFQKLLFQYPVSSIQHPVSSIQHPVSSIQHPVSSIQHPISSIQHPVSSIQYPVSSIQYPASSIKYPASSIQHPASSISFWIFQIPV